MKKMLLLRGRTSKYYRPPGTCLKDNVYFISMDSRAKKNNRKNPAKSSWVAIFSQKVEVRPKMVKNAYF